MGKTPRGGKLAALGGSSTSSGASAPRPTPTVASMLQELQSLIKQTQDERDSGAQTLAGIGKTHDRMKNEVRVSPYFKQKLLGLYQNALQDAKKVLALIEQSQGKMAAVKQEIGEKQARPVTQPKDVARRSGMRRGMLMTVLHQYALEQPVWLGKPGESPPSLCGCIPADDKYKCKPSDQVAARVRTEDGEEQWILAEVVSYNSHNHRYIVDDIDEEGHNEKRRYHVSKRRIIPLPMYKADPQTTLQALFKPKQLVLALYPQTTCFYRAIIHEKPKDVSSEH